jgi:protein-S-isoprenylcysteine O-methyltransferase Ste14
MTSAGEGPVSVERAERSVTVMSRLPVRPSAAIRAGVRRWAAKQLAVDVAGGGLLFLAAGTWRWAGGWRFVALVVASQSLQGLFIGRRRPDLLAERSGLGEGADRSDVPLALAMAYGPLVASFAAALEHHLGRAPAVQPGIMAASLGGAAGALALSIAAMDANAYFAPVLRIQAERGHVVADSGPYALVRHPGYAGAALSNLALPALLGSRAAIPFAVAGVAVALARTAREDRFLAAHLPGYAAYVQRVRWRLLPGAW